MFNKWERLYERGKPMLKTQNDLSMLIDRYTPYIAKIVSSVGGHFLSNEDIEEIVSDTFFTTWQYRKKLIHGDDIKPYMAQIARNKTKNQLRKLAKISSIIIENIDSTNDINDSDNIFVLDHIITDLQIEEIQNIVNRFDTPEKEILYGYYFYEFKLSEIANRLNLPLSTVKSKLYRSRGKLQQLLIEGGLYEEYI